MVLFFEMCYYQSGESVDNLDAAFPFVVVPDLEVVEEYSSHGFHVEFVSTDCSVPRFTLPNWIGNTLTVHASLWPDFVGE